MKMGIMSKMMLNILVPSMLGLTAVCVFSYWRAETSLTQQIAHELMTVHHFKHPVGVLIRELPI